MDVQSKIYVEKLPRKNFPLIEGKVTKRVEPDSNPSRSEGGEFSQVKDRDGCGDERKS